MAYSTLSLLGTFLLLLLRQHHVQAQTAPAPSSGSVNITGILEKGGQFTTFIRLLQETQVADQIKNQLKSSTQGMTVFAPTDNAFNNLKAGTINGLSRDEQVKLILYHVLPQYYTMDNLLTVPNPVRTQFSDDDLNFTGQSHQVNVSSGLVVTQVNNALSVDFPLAVYQLDSVLLPPSLFGAKPPASAPPPAKSTPADSSGKTNSTKASAPSSEDSSRASTRMNVNLGLVLGLLGLAFNLS